ncbi:MULTISPECIES: hypothetical protein [unclassified Caballeronia]|uniref:hypothetical protein n=1 Tax=unclassified Caballeronia TaxID=2646786 RepID=UPI002028875A|nr:MULTISPECIES: hypothetical protein [unclassified Caballeronia]MDR5775141.1 hypothetical protein [Caballeronia sp. LZ002]MDR5850579.1 hypothetical protein [Caballeronia sp. LZ003]
MSHATLSDDREVQAQVCAFNTAFEELDLMFRWDADTYRALASTESDYGKIAQYIATHSPHLLKAYSAEFLCGAIVERKNSTLEACRQNTVQYEDSTQRARLWRARDDEGKEVRA